MRLVASEFVSLDGIMEDPGGAEGYEHAGWHFRSWAPEMGAIKKAELFASDGLLLGRVTYEGFAAAWPTVKDDEGFADRMNGLPKYVVSSTLDTLEWNNSHLLKGDLIEEVTKLKQQPGNDLLIGGSATLVQELARHNLIDLYRLAVHPVSLGTGKRLFGNVHVNLEFVEQRPTPNGVIFLSYRPAPDS
jgi:dihydrofolate reductase